MKNDQYEIKFPDYYDELYEFECESKGYMNNIEVYLKDGGKYSLCFMGPFRINQDLESEVNMGNSFLFEPNLIIVPKVNKKNIVSSIEQVYKEALFTSMKPF
jgi:hypothetical protein